MHIVKRSQFGSWRSYLKSMALHPTGDYLACGFYDGSIQVWSVLTGRIVGTMAHHAEYCGIADLAFSPDGTLLASASDDASLRLWDVASQREVQRLAQQRPHDDDSQTAWEQWDRFLPLSIQFSPDGAILASGQLGGGAIKLWHTHSGKEYGLLAGHPARLQALPYPQFFSPAEREHLPRPGHVVALAFTPDGQTLLSASQDNTMGVWDVRTLQGERRVSPHTYYLDALAIHPHHAYAVSGGSTVVGIGERRKPAPVIHHWKLPELDYVSSLPPTRSLVEALQFTPDGQHLVGADTYGSIFWWNTNTWERSAPMQIRAPILIDLCMSADGKHLWIAGTSVGRRRSQIEHWEMSNVGEADES